MAKYGEIIAKIEELQKEADRVRKQEVRAAIAEIKKKIREYDLTLDDLRDVLDKPGAKKRGRKGARKVGRPAGRKSSGKRGKVAPKYRHPTSGDTWSGRGSVPKWLKAEVAAGRNRDDFLI